MDVDGPENFLNSKASFQKSLDFHPNNIPEGKKFLCPKCGKTFSKEVNFIEHRRLHTGEKPHECLKCELKFAKKQDLHEHCSQSHLGETFDCSECGKAFMTIYHLRWHTKIHSQDKKFKCPTCEAKFERKAQLAKHLSTKHHEKPYECVHCGKKYEYKSNLCRHVRTHREPKSYKCHVCDTAFFRNDYLQRHILAHESESTLQCPECGLQFRQMSHLTNHIQNNTCKKRCKGMKKDEEEDEGTKLHSEENAIFFPVKTEEPADSVDVQQAQTSSAQILNTHVKDENVTNQDIHVEKDEVQTAEEFVRIQLAKLAEMAQESYRNQSDSIPTITSNLGNLVVAKQLSGPKCFKSVWKFNCQQVLSRNPESRASNLIWKLRPENPADRGIRVEKYPLCISLIIQSFDKFLFKLSNRTRDLLHEFFRNKDSTALMNVTLHVNSKGDVMVRAVVNHDSPIVKHELQQYLHFLFADTWNVKSIYFKTGTKSKPILLCGVQEIYEQINGIQIQMSSNENFSLNLNNIEILTESIEDYLLPCPETTLLEIGCGNGLLLASKCKHVIGIDCSLAVNAAQKICQYNNITNVTFEDDGIRNVEKLFEKIENCSRVIAIVNQQAECGLSMTIMKYLKKLKPLDRLAVVTSCSTECFPSLLELMKPKKNNSFIPQRSCVVDSILDEGSFKCVTLMERNEIVYVKQEPRDET